MEIKLNSKCAREITVFPSMCDSSFRLSAANAFGLFMDIASVHAEELGMDGAAMAKRGLFWLTVRTRIHFFRRPSMMENVTATTWPEKPGKVRCMRYYTLKNGEETLLEGKTEWAVLDLKTGKLHNASDIYAADYTMLEDVVCGTGFSHMSEVFDRCREKAPYTVKMSDIDFGGHMNNAAYPRVILDTFTAKEAEVMNIQEMEVSFRSPCYEGETLRIFERQNGNELEFGMFRPDGKCASLVKIVCGE